MRLDGMGSWRVVQGSHLLIDCALWIRAAERLVVVDPLVPGPLDEDHLPAPISVADHVIADQWLGWWYSLIAPRWRSLAPGKSLEPAYDTLDPLGLAPYPELAVIVARRGSEALTWRTARQHQWIRQHLPPSGTTGEVIREVERAVGHKVKPFEAEFVLIPVRDDVIRRIEDERHLVPERVVDGPNWAGWIRELVTRVGL